MSIENFKKLNIDPAILKVIEEMGFDYPTAIQKQAIPFLTSSNRDFVGQAQTGTGKTFAFVVPLLQKVDPENSNVQALVLTPTRELAFQVEAEIEKLGKYMNIGSTCIYGGTSYDKQIGALKKGRPQIVVGTPGRVIDLIKRKVLKLDHASLCVLDEADEMLNMGFLEDVQTILDMFHEERQLMMFSATMPKPVLNLIDKSFKDYELIQIKNKSLSNDDIEQKYFVVKEKHFKESLARLIDASPEVYALVFCRTRLETKTVGDDLKKRGYAVEVLNGDMGQAERDHAMRNFKSKKANIMVCTDVAARGIDVTNLTHVFNYGLPQDNEAYVHRIGRTGRAGMKGKAYTIVGSEASFIIQKISKHINKDIELGKLPSIEELKKKVVEKEIAGAEQILSAIQEKGENFKTDDAFSVFKAQFADLSKEELLKLMFTWKFNNVLRHYNNLSDIENSPKGIIVKGPKKRRGGYGQRKSGARRSSDKRSSNRPSRR